MKKKLPLRRAGIPPCPPPRRKMLRAAAMPAFTHLRRRRSGDFQGRAGGFFQSNFWVAALNSKQSRSPRLNPHGRDGRPST